MRKGIAVVLFLGLIVGSATTVMAQGGGRGGGGGGGNGGGGGGGESGDTPLIIVFRDAPDDPATEEFDGDRLRSDDLGAYIDGDPDLDGAILDDQGSVWLDFLGGKKGTAPAGARKITVNALGAEDSGPGDSILNYDELTDPLYAGRSGNDPLPDFLSSGPIGVGGRHISVFGVDEDGIRTDENIGGVTGTSWTTFSVFFDEPDSRNSWKVSYGSNTFDGPPAATGIPNLEGEGLPYVHCVNSTNPDYPCVAWVVEKESGLKQTQPDQAGLSEVNRAAIVDAGEYIMPFAFGICVKAHIEAMYTAPTFEQLEQGCRTVLGARFQQVPFQ